MLLVGDKLCVLGDWDNTPVPEGRIPIRLTPSMVFGTGYDPTTFQFLLSLESLVSWKRGISYEVLDVGCGSGILSIAAAKMGATRVYAKDHSSEAVLLARENVELNGVEGIVKVSQGTYLPKGLPASEMVDLVLCNIGTPEVLKDIMDYSREVLFLGGRLVLSYWPESFSLEEVLVGYRIQSSKDLPGPGKPWKLVVLEWKDD